MNFTLIQRFASLLLFLLLFTGSKAQFYNGSQMEFGKNRVQYNGFTWQSQNYERFKIYYYIGGKTHAAYIAQSAHKYLQEIEKLFDFYIDEKIEFIIYNSQSQFRQSNIGITGDVQYNIGGVTRIVGSKVFLYYEGDHKKLDEQIRGGIAYILLNHMMYGSNWKDVLKNSTLMTLPAWYLEGFVSYVSNPWDVEIESYVRDGVLSGRYSRFYRLEGMDAKYAGHAMWNYIAEVYGEGVIPNILYMTRISRNVESGFLYVFGVSLKKLSSEYISYYKQKFSWDEETQKAPTQEIIPVKKKTNRIYYQLKLSPDGRYAAFVSNEMGQYKIWLYDISKQEIRKIAKGEHKLNRLNDYSYPVLGWHPGGAGLAFAVEKKGELYFNIYSIDDKKTSKKVIGKLDKILSFDYSDDGKRIVMSGVAKGQTDLFIFNPVGNALEQITDDIFDDLQPKFVDKSSAVIFSSNRLSDTIFRETEVKPYPHKKDIFIIELNKPSRTYRRITSTPDVDESWPSQLDTVNYTYLSDENGVINRYMAFYDSTISTVDTVVHYRYFTKTIPLTNYNRNILEYDMNEKKGKYALLMLVNGEYNFYIGKLKDDQRYTGPLPLTRFKIQEMLAKQKMQVPDPRDTSVVRINIDSNDPVKSDTGFIDINNYRFNDEKPVYEKETITIEEKSGKNKDDTTLVKAVAEKPFKPAQQSLYKVNFATDYIVSQLDNSYLNQTYQRFSPGGGYFNPGLSALIKMGISDVFEDYRIIGGFRFAGNFGSNEYLLMYQDLSRRLDKHYIAYRQTFSGLSQKGESKTFIHDFKFHTRYPFNEVLSLRGTINYRNDHVVTLATNSRDLHVPNENFHLAGSKLELVFDNTIPKGLNLYNGLRFKIWGEYYREFITEQSNFIVTGMDFRHYLKIHRDFIWANRLAASASLGSKRLVYYMGGVDNWISPRFDPTVQIAQDQNYAYQTIATPVRGFFQNARNGSNFAVINSELRFPLFKYFAEKPLKSDFAENFQILGFFDIGTAWTGWNPYSDENSFNRTIIASPGSPIYVVLENQREPIIYGWGWGLRSRLFGYFIRFDWAVGTDDGVRYEPVKYLSLSLDF